MECKNCFAQYYLFNRTTHTEFCDLCHSYLVKAFLKTIDMQNKKVEA
jgi:hypothetical protein